MLMPARPSDIDTTAARELLINHQDRASQLSLSFDNPILHREQHLWRVRCTSSAPSARVAELGELA
jgi:hypothetical protein